MGAVSFSLSSELVNALKSELKLTILVETGTFEGDTVAEFQDQFETVISIELSPKLQADAVKRFAHCPNVEILAGDSAENLHLARPNLEHASALYWLDAHWCVASGTAGELSQCPLLDELRAIGRLNSQSVVLIDDARLFLAPPLAPHNISDWPRLHEIIECLSGLSSEHELMVINDVIAFYPKIAREAMTNYAQTQGIDWLFASNCMKQDGTVMRQLEQKERVIQEKEMAIRALETSLQEKENAIRELAEIVRTYSAVFSIPIIGTFLRLGNRARILLMPRLGNLNQYPPTPLAANRFATNTAVLPVTAPKISIVTPSYQQGKYIGRTIESVLSQGYPNLEYFVQDGLSSDESVDVIKSYANGITGWASEPDGGQSEAINRGLARSSGEIMAWLNSDDMLLPGTLAVVADFFARHPHVDVVYGNRLLIDVGDQEIGRWILPGHSNSVLSWVDFVPQETMFWRRRIWEKVGSRIDESYRFAMDWDLLLRFRDAGAQFAHIPKFLGAFRIHDRQKTSAQINQVGMQEMNRLRERVLGFVPADSVVRRHASLYMLRHVAVDLWHRMKLQWTCLQRG